MNLITRSAPVSMALIVFMHSAALADGQQAGKLLFDKLNCAQCHSIAGKGGCLGPPLDGVVKHRDMSYLRMRLNKDDDAAFVKLIGHPELMPHPRFEKTEVNNLLVFLAKLPETKPIEAHHDSKPISVPDDKYMVKPSAENIADGKRLFYKCGCLSCHSVGNTGGQIGPALDGIGKKRNPSSLESFISNPGNWGTRVMPQIVLTDKERTNIVRFLLSLPAAQAKTPRSKS